MARKKFKISRVRGLLLASGAIVAGASLFTAMSLQQNSEYVDALTNNNLANVLPSQMTDLTLSLVYTGAEVDGTVNSTQSFAITDDYFVAVQAHSSNENSGWLVATDFASPSSTPAWQKSYNVGHGNGATWNSTTNQLVITDGSTRMFFNATNGNFVNSLNVSTSASGIAYNSAKNQYIQTSGDYGEILDSNFNLLMTFDAANRLVNQDVAYHNGYIYRVVWGGCNYLRENNRTQDADYCDQYFGNNSDVLYQFDLDGNFTRAFYIEAGFGELESVDFGPDGAMYLLFNNKPDSTHYSVYKATKQIVTFANSSVSGVFSSGDTFTNAASSTGNGTITYSSSNTSVATVNSSTGEVTVVGPGSTTITAQAAATATYGADSTTYTLSVKLESAEPAEIQEMKEGYYTDALNTITLNTSGLVWADGTEIIELGQNQYAVYYTENNDPNNYTTEEYEITVNGIRRSYEITEGAGQTYTIGVDTSGYTNFKANANYSLFQTGGEVYIDNTLVGQEYYTSEEGSTIIGIKNSYLDTLAVGQHELKVYFNDGGEATASFAVAKKEPVDPGDDPDEPEEPDDDSSDDVVVPDTGTNGDKQNNSGNTKIPNTGENVKNETDINPMLMYLVPIALACIGIWVRINNKSKKHRKFD